MKLKFEANLQYQKEAIDSVVKLFEGAPYIRPEDRISQEVSPNILKITQESVFKNYDNIAFDSLIDESKQARNSELLDFSVEMETGTGKTYIYLRTILELYRSYGLTKFLIVVPSIAVKEGVMKTLDMTKDHFNDLYNEKIQYFEYDSKKTTRVRHFAYGNTLQVMVINVQAFNADDNIINQERDANNGAKLIDLIRSVRPVVIMDEPQEGMDSKNMEKRFDQLDPLFKLRYSATHKKPINLVYRLTPYEAYNQGLVKKIEVYSIHEENTQSNVEIEFMEIKLTSAKPEAKLQLNYKVGIDFKTKTGLFKELDDLEEKTKNPAYKGWIIERIYKDLMDSTEKIKFSNGIELTKGSKHGWDKESIFREQIRWTIRRHFQKKEQYKDLGIKVLSLFFIDRVANYVFPEGIIRKLFVELFIQEYKEKYGKEPLNIDQVHNGYFAKTRSDEYTDNVNSMQKNKEIYNLIMKDKERLLSLEEPLEFIFSHSALGVGWDNPNVFQICTLNESHSEAKKRQEIGRGLRICVDKTGERYRDLDTVTEGQEINLLTVIPNESYHAFVTQYQDEIIEETGDARQTKVRNAKKGANKIGINRDILNSDDFQNLWKKIQKKTKYMVSFREQELVDKCVDELNSIVVREQIIQTQAIQIKSLSELQDINENILSKGETSTKAKSSVANIDLIDQISEQTSLSIKTVIEILSKISNSNMLTRNPIVYLTDAVKQIKKVLNNEMVRVISYKPTNEEFPIEDFEKFDPQTYNDVVSAHKGVYDAVEYDSNIEKDFVLDIDQENKVKAFVKLPKWYKINTPIGTYNPDFALIMEKKDLEKGGETKYYFVVETKGTDEWNELKEEEKMKIECAVKHFEAIGFEKYMAPIKNLNSLKSKTNLS
ncbi:MAG: Type III site-specific deoxyribonuclease [candidate division WS6 bacterium GW2011_GWC2_36_7]|uniref:Type III site-specific deoxyribonuclease n=1 Tax=candidate division WS6 bacterium GW2011_GWC2_36_7 TaxID=1619091 RepID=A0A0G0EWJ0_9BACT|nr:MAG: Type III site-specific deoxyribonuclease [candidate division WS6 bacterium GW2011_GWC2_36_7]